MSVENLGFIKTFLGSKETWFRNALTIVVSSPISISNNGSLVLPTFTVGSILDLKKDSKVLKVT